MKHLMITALLAFITIAASAQFSNNTNCDLRIRVVCFDESSCSVVGGSAGPWTTISAMGSASIPTGSCSSPYTLVYEVDYAPSTGCSGNPVFFSTNSTTACIPPNTPPGTTTWHPGASGMLPSCACNSGGAFIDVMFHYDPFLPLITFDAH